MVSAGRNITDSAFAFELIVGPLYIQKRFKYFRICFTPALNSAGLNPQLKKVFHSAEEKAFSL